MSIIRHVAAVGSATLVSRLLGFVRDIAIAGLFGAGARADAFFVSFQIANLARRLLAEGALNAAFVPLYLKIRTAQGQEAADVFAGRVVGTITVTLLGLAFLLAVAMPVLILFLAPGFAANDPRMGMAIEFGRLSLPYLVFAGPAALIAGVLNANQRFAAVAWVAALFNIVVLFALAIVFVARLDDSGLSGRILAASIALAGFFQLLLVVAILWRGPYRIARPVISFGPQTRDFMRLAIPGLIANGIPQFTMIAGVMAASALPSAISWLYYAQRLIELPLGIIGIAIGTVLLPALSHALNSDQPDDVAAAESRGLELALGLALPAAIALALLAEPIVRTLFERGAFSAADSAATAAALAVFALGLPGHVLAKTWAPLFFARGDTRTPMLAGLFGLAIASLGSFALMPMIGHVGVATAIAASGWASAGLLAILIHRKMGLAFERDTPRRIALILLASLVMGVGVNFLNGLLQSWFTPAADTLPKLAALGCIVGAGIGIYGAALMAFGVVRWSELPSRS